MKMPGISSAQSAKFIQLKVHIEAARLSLLDAMVIANELHVELTARELDSMDDRGPIAPERCCTRYPLDDSTEE